MQAEPFQVFIWREGLDDLRERLGRTRCKEFPRGGHFLAAEDAHFVAIEIREFFRQSR